MPEATDILERQIKDLERKNEALISDNGKQRDELREARDGIKTLEQERDTLKAQLPAEGSVVLNKADDARFSAYKALGPVDEVSAKVKGYNDLETKDKQRTREDGVKQLNLKPSVFEVIAQGAAYRVEGEGDERRILLSVDDKEVELSEHAKAKGLEDLLGVMGLGEAPPKPDVSVPTGAGTRKLGKFKVLSASERAKQKEKESRYSGI